jgi:hypothetical protein
MGVDSIGNEELEESSAADEVGRLAGRDSEKGERRREPELVCFGNLILAGSGIK